jgi:hypothetical protein
MGFLELAIIVCGGSLVLLATIAVGYLFLKNNRSKG